MKTKNNFFKRKCLICKNHKHKSEFIRFYIRDSMLFIDQVQNVQCRGYYVCNNLNEINKFLKRYQHSKSDIKLSEQLISSLNNKK